MFAVFVSLSFDRLWLVDSPPRCSPIVVYCDSGFSMVSSHQQVVGLCSKAIFWRRVPGQAIIYRLVLICLLVPSLEAPDPACCALQPNPSSASCVVFSLALGYIPKSCFPFCFFVVVICSFILLLSSATSLSL